MGQCWNCPNLTPTATAAGRAKCCQDSHVIYTLSVQEERERALSSDSLMLRIPGRSAERGEITHKRFADMNRKERRAVLSGSKR